MRGLIFRNRDLGEWCSRLLCSMHVDDGVGDLPVLAPNELVEDLEVGLVEMGMVDRPSPEGVVASGGSRYGSLGVTEAVVGTDSIVSREGSRREERGSFKLFL